MQLLSINYLLFSCFVGLVAYAAYTDLTEMKISNKISLALIGLWPAYLLSSNSIIDPVGSLTAAAIIFAIGFVLFALGKIGGGDVKLFASVALWCTPDVTVTFVVVASIAGVAYGLVTMSGLRDIIQYYFSKLGLASIHETLASRKVPFGVGIAVGALTVVAPSLYY